MPLTPALSPEYRREGVRCQVRLYHSKDRSPMTLPLRPRWSRLALLVAAVACAGLALEIAPAVRAAPKPASPAPAAPAPKPPKAAPQAPQAVPDTLDEATVKADVRMRP